MRGTIQLNSEKVKVFLPELMCDFFIGVLKPNQMTIDSDSYEILTADVDIEENDIVEADLSYYEKTCIVTEKE